MPLQVLTLESLRERLGAIERTGQKGFCWLLSSLVSMLFVLVGVAILAPGGPAPAWFFVAGPLSFAPVPCTVVWMSLRLSRQRAVCPACDCKLEGYPQISEVVATRRCVHCQNVIIGTEGELVQLTETHQPSETPQSRKLQRLLLLGRTGAVWWIGAILYAAIARLLFDHYQPWLANQLGEIIVPFVMPIISVPGVALLGWGLLRGLKQFVQCDYNCPKCTEPLSEHTLQSTGCCGRCGAIIRPERMVASADPPVDGSLTLSEFRDRSLWSGPNAWVLLAEYLLMFAGMVVFPWVGSWPFYGIAVAIFSYFLLTELKRKKLCRSLNCPACSRSLFTKGWLTISTRRCGHCGCTVIRDDSV